MQIEKDDESQDLPTLGQSQAADHSTFQPKDEMEDLLQTLQDTRWMQNVWVGKEQEAGEQGVELQTDERPNNYSKQQQTFVSIFKTQV